MNEESSNNCFHPTPGKLRRSLRHSQPGAAEAKRSVQEDE